MSAQERVDRRNTAWWLERKANDQAREQARLEQMRKDDMEVAAYWEARKEKEHADIMANFNEWAMEKSLPAEVPAVEFEDEVELPKSLIGA